MDSIVIPHTKAIETKLPFWLVKLIRFEFWPTWALYWPVVIYGLWLALKARSLTFFTTANPLMYLGGLVGESKESILKTIPKQYLPTTLYVDAGEKLNNIVHLLNAYNLSYPIIVKPDIGERGRGVAKINSEPELEIYLRQNRSNLVVQSFISYPIELGVLYYRFPNGLQSGITSIVCKSFLSITGNGSDCLETLIRKDVRANLQLNYLLNKFSNRLQEVVPYEESIVLEPIGNHCRGTTFYDANHLISPQLVKVFDAIASQIDGFYIGRFDLKVSSIKDLLEGNNIQIMELNGVTSEPAHIYDPSASLVKAYKALLTHWRLVYEIAYQNHIRGYDYATFKTVVNELRKKHE
ncbi:MAG: ATP-grasp domain-containing protein [Bacteroidia bacterium]|jgi:hypothetical protein|nr:ATP-grasp domain-containing protein [Bacteroidia bacterium]